MSNLIGNAPNQVPTNADLGGLAYQDADHAIVGNINIETTLVNSGTTTLTGNVTLAASTTVTGNIFVTTNSYDANAVVNKSYIDAASVVWGF